MKKLWTNNYFRTTALLIGLLVAAIYTIEENGIRSMCKKNGYDGGSISIEGRQCYRFENVSVIKNTMVFYPYVHQLEKQ